MTRDYKLGVYLAGANTCSRLLMYGFLGNSKIVAWTCNNTDTSIPPGCMLTEVLHTQGLLAFSLKLAHSPSRDFCSPGWGVLEKVSVLLSPSSSGVGVGAPPSADRQKWSHMSEDTLTLLNMRWVTDTAVCYPSILAVFVFFADSHFHSCRVKL